MMMYLLMGQLKVQKSLHQSEGLIPQYYHGRCESALWLVQPQGFHAFSKTNSRLRCVKIRRMGETKKGTPDGNPLAMIETTLMQFKM